MWGGKRKEGEDGIGSMGRKEERRVRKGQVV
jgi:hypothetical protein